MSETPANESGRVSWPSMYCPHGMAAYVVCAKCVEQARQERREDRQVEAFDRLSEVLAALHDHLKKKPA